MFRCALLIDIFFDYLYRRSSGTEYQVTAAPKIWFPVKPVQNNIGARYFLRTIKKSIPATEWSQAVAKVPGLAKRTIWTLDTLKQTASA
jgi:hypothetical protein